MGLPAPEVEMPVTKTTITTSEINDYFFFPSLVSSTKQRACSWHACLTLALLPPPTTSPRSVWQTMVLSTSSADEHVWVMRGERPGILGSAKWLQGRFGASMSLSIPACWGSEPMWRGRHWPQWQIEAQLVLAAPLGAPGSRNSQLCHYTARVWLRGMALAVSWWPNRGKKWTRGHGSSRNVHEYLPVVRDGKGCSLV